jgi:VanZ family protein
VSTPIDGDEDAKRMRYAALWHAVGRIGIVMTIALSLLPVPDVGLHVEQGDKIGHVLAYFALTFWYAQLSTTRRQLALRALAVLALGLTMEALQTLMPWRSGNDPWDMLANTVGVAAATLAGLTPLRGLLSATERRVLAYFMARRG